jgi:hypothetical protein
MLKFSIFDTLFHNTFNHTKKRPPLLGAAFFISPYYFIFAWYSIRHSSEQNLACATFLNASAPQFLQLILYPLTESVSGFITDSVIPPPLTNRQAVRRCGKSFALALPLGG